MVLNSATEATLFIQMARQGAGFAIVTLGDFAVTLDAQTRRRGRQAERTARHLEPCAAGAQVEDV